MSGTACAALRQRQRSPAGRRRAGGLRRVSSAGRRWWHRAQAGSHARGADPFATTSMRRSSATGTSRFMSASLTCRATLAPASRQTRATACSRGSARAARTPEVAQAVRWSPRGSSAPWQRHLRGARGRGRRRRRSRRTRNCALGMAMSSRVGMRFSAREAKGPCLRQQQRSRRGGEVRKMRLVRALITGTESRMLPALDRPRVVGVVWVRGRSGGTGAEGQPRQAPQNQGRIDVLGHG